MPTRANTQASTKNMWYPFPMVLPLALLPHRDSDNLQRSCASGIIQMNMLPYRYDQRLFPNAMNQLADPLTIGEGRKFILNRSVFDLVEVTHFLELTDPKLLGWYLSLPVEDRRLIQEEGGLHQFLQRHPALEVVGQLVYVKKLVDSCVEPPDIRQTMSSSNLNKSRRPSFYGGIQCPNCGTSCSSGGKRCRRCNTPIQKMIPACRTDEWNEFSLLPNNVKQELNLFHCSRHEGVQSVQVHHHVAPGALQQYRDCQLQPFTTTTTTSRSNALGGLINLQESFHSACGVTSERHIGAAEDLLAQKEAHVSKVQLLSRLWEEGGWQDDCNNSSVDGCRDADTQASHCLDMELEMQIQSAVKKGQSAICNQGESMTVPSQMTDSPILDRVTPPEYYSFNSTQDYSEWNDTSNTSNNIAELECDKSLSLMDTRRSTEQPSRAEEAKPGEGDMLSYCVGVSSEFCDCTRDNCPAQLADAEKVLKCKLQNQNIMNEDVSNLTEKGTKKGAADSNLTPSQTNSDHSGWSRESLTAPQSPPKNEQSIFDESFTSISPGAEVGTPTHGGNGVVVASAVNLNQTFVLTPPNVSKPEEIIAARSRNTSPLPAKYNMSVGTDQTLSCCRLQSQVQGTASADKNVITEVHMADMDYLAEEFIKLLSSKEELNKLKEKMASSAGVRDAGGICGGVDGGCGGCDCAERAMRAELSLLTLQYGMCQQHCWRRYYTSPEGDLLVQGPEALPESLMKVLQVLEVDYRDMRRLVLSGVPLDQLRPLSVNSKTISSETSYIPALIIYKSLGNAMAGASDGSAQVEDAHRLGGEGSTGIVNEESPKGKGPVVHPNAEGTVVHWKTEDFSSEKAVSLVPQKPVVGCCSRPGDHNHATEAWYDAEEDLVPNGAAVEGRSLDVGVEEEEYEVIGLKEKDQRSFLLVTGLPTNVTKAEMMLWFEKYQPCEVNISTFSNNIRVAIVTVSGSKRADSAVSEMDGCRMQGHAVHVQHILRPSTGSQKPGQNQPGPSTSIEPESSGIIPGSQDSKKSNIHTTIQPMALPLSLQKRTTICDSPTASGTCVPQHYATMGSFDTVMARLSERHPDVGRQRIVNALLELRAEHQGSLCGLPLRTIVDMTSDLLKP